MLARLQQEYQYDGIETCAGDGTCAIPCPIGINTGALIKEFRALENGPTGEGLALRAAHFGSRAPAPAAILPSKSTQIVRQ